MNSKNITLEKTTIALKELNSALSECSSILSEKRINADQKDNEHKKLLDDANKKIELLKQGSKNTIDNINDLVVKLDKVLG